MNRFLILLTMLLMPLSALGQSTAVLDGIGLANGKSYTNYIKNPNAQKNVSNVTAVSGSTITRVAGATALYQGTEFSIDDTNAWGAEWSAMALNPGLKNRLCEVQILAKSDAADAATLEVLQNSVAVFTQSLTLDASNPKKFGGTFPCGDLTYTSSVKLSGTSNPGAVKVAAVYLGEPVSVSSGGITTPETTYTAASFGGQGTLAVTQNELKWWRVGQHIYVRGRVTIGAGTGAASSFSVPFPTGVALASGGVARQVAQATFYDASGGTQTINIPVADPGDTSFIFVKTGGGAILGSDLGASDELTFTAGPFAVAGWSATDIVTPEASLVEYASNNGPTWDATNSSDFTVNTNASTGSLIGGTLTASNRVKRVRFQKAVLATDTIVFEVSTDQLRWMPLQGTEATTGALPFTQQNTTLYGAAVRGGTIATTTDVDVVFGQYIYASGATYGAAGTNWPGSGLYWRVKKMPAAGTQSFYIQGPTKGGNSGNAIPTGYVGEKLTGAISSSTGNASGTVVNCGSSLTLTSGRWMVYGSATVYGSNLSTSAVSISTTSATEATLTRVGVFGFAHTQAQLAASPLVVDVTTTQSVYLTCSCTTSASTWSVDVAGNGQFYAIRLD